jgi:sulfite exporter TauE/SafE
MFFLEGLIIGFVGSLHCLGMCGPLVLALPVSNKSNIQRIFGGLLYNIGRAVTYAALGLIFGLIGQGFYLAGIQRWVSVVFGAILILAVIVPGFINLTPLVNKITMKGTSALKLRMGSLLKQKSIYPLFLFGLLNGLLPCGLVYMAVIGALVSSSLIDSMLYMFFFGLGTLPLMFVLIYFSSLIKNKLLSKVKKLIPVFIIILGLLFILRGMNLGIKYISPKIDKAPSEMHKMHAH